MFENDFPATDSQAETHKKLMRRKRKPNEELVEYNYAMLTIGRRGGLDDISINSYIISGLNDNNVTKTLDAMNITTCMESLKSHRNLSSVVDTNLRTPTTSSVVNKTEVRDMVKKKNGPKCFNCNDYGHIVTKCPYSSRKPRCLKCSKIGHEANNCKVGVESVDAKVHQLQKLFDEESEAVWQ